MPTIPLLLYTTHGQLLVVYYSLSRVTERERTKWEKKLENENLNTEKRHLSRIWYIYNRNSTSVVPPGGLNTCLVFGLAFALALGDVASGVEHFNANSAN